MVGSIGISILGSLMAFLLCSWLGKIQYDTSVNLFQDFEYSYFSFNSPSSTNYAGQVFQKILIPIIFSAAVCVIMQRMDLSNISIVGQLIVIFYWAIRIIYILITNRFGITNWAYEITEMVISIILNSIVNFAIIRPILNDNESLFISATEFRDAFWFSTIAYSFGLAWKIAKEYTTHDKIYSSDRLQQFIIHRYHILRQKYEKTVLETIRNEFSFPNECIKNSYICTVFSIMIYEDYCRPPVFRGLERLMFLLRLRRNMSLGIMQVQSYLCLNNTESLKMGMRKIYSVFAKNSFSYSSYLEAIMEYNCGKNYFDQVQIIYNTINSAEPRYM